MRKRRFMSMAMQRAGLMRARMILRSALERDVI
jgi:hypothetical protein